jgi:hypothetical protein
MRYPQRRSIHNNYSLCPGAARPPDRRVCRRLGDGLDERRAGALDLRGLGARRLRLGTLGRPRDRVRGCRWSVRLPDAGRGSLACRKDGARFSAPGKTGGSRSCGAVRLMRNGSPNGGAHRGHPARRRSHQTGDARAGWRYLMRSRTLRAPRTPARATSSTRLSRHRTRSSSSRDGQASMAHRRITARDPTAGRAVCRAEASRDPA